MSEKADKKYDFLKKEPWSALKNIKFEKLCVIYDTAWNEEAEARPELLEKDPAGFKAQVLRVFKGKIKRKEGSALTSGTFGVWGTNAPFNYVEQMKKKCHAVYLEDPDKAIDEGYVRKEVDKFGEEKLVYLDYREKFSTGKKNDNFREPLDNISGWMFEIFASWEPDSGEGRRFVSFNIGGESNAAIASPVCPDCGEVNVYSKTCRKCGAINSDYIFPDFFNHRYALFKVQLNERKDEATEAVTLFWAHPDSNFNEKADFKGNLIDYLKETAGYSIKSSDGKKKLVAGFKNLVVTSKTILKWWEAHKSAKEKRNETTVPAIFVGDLTKRYAKESKKGDHRIDIDDDESDFIDGEGKVARSTKVNVPEHVWNYDVAKKIDVDSMVVVIGKVDRWQQYDFKARRQIAGKWNDPHITAMAVIGVPGFVRVPKEVSPVEEEKPVTPKAGVPSKAPAKTKKPAPKKADLEDEADKIEEGTVGETEKEKTDEEEWT